MTAEAERHRHRSADTGSVVADERRSRRDQSQSSRCTVFESPASFSLRTVVWEQAPRRSTTVSRSGPVAACPTPAPTAAPTGPPTTAPVAAPAAAPSSAAKAAEPMRVVAAIASAIRFMALLRRSDALQRRYVLFRSATEQLEPSDLAVRYSGSSAIHDT